jgi:uncharacterized repeat protein (TIGR01451 family)
MRFTALAVLLLLLGAAHAQSSVVFEKSLSKSVVAVGEPVTVVLTVSNNGKEAITDLKLKDSVSLPGFSYNYLEYLSYLAPGEKRSFTYTIVPTQEGNFTLPSAELEFSVGGKKVTLRSDEVELHVVAVAPPPSGSTQNFTGDVANKSAETRLYPEPKKGLTVKQALKFSLIGFLGLLPFAYLAFKRFGKRGREIAKIYQEKKIEAPKRDVFKEAKEVFYGGKKKEAFIMISEELKQIFNRRYSPDRKLTLREYLALLEKDEVDEEVKSLARDTVKLCELVEFANYEASPEEFHLALKGLSKVKTKLEKAQR